jgi:hypothetical protein
MSDGRQPRRDVYLGDLSTASGSLPLVRVVFDVRADADPGALPRVAATLALGNVAPQRFDCAQVAPGQLLITAWLDGITEASAELILRKLQQLSIVIEATLSSEDRAARVRGPTA